MAFVKNTGLFLGCWQRRLYRLTTLLLLAGMLSGCAFARIQKKRQAIEQAYAAGQISAGEYFMLDQALDEEGHRLRMFMAGGVAGAARQLSANAAAANRQQPQMQQPKSYLVTPSHIGGKIEDGAIITPR